MADIIGFIGALVGLGLGLLGLARPAAALRLVGLTTRPDIPHGVAEVRGTYGGLFVGFEAVILLSGMPALYAVGAGAWFGAAAGRSFSVAWDGVRGRETFIAVAFEVTVGLAHLAPVLAA